MEQAGPFLEQCSGHSFVTMNTVPEDLAPTTLLPGMELCDLRIGASVPALFFTIPLQEAALVTIHFQEFNTASRCILLASSRDSHPTTETAIWRLSSPLPVKTMTIHPADDNYSLGQLFFCVRYLEENGSTFVRLHVTLDRDYSALWYHRTRRALRSGPALSILSRQTVRRPATATATSSPQISAGEYSGEFSPVFNTNHHHSTAPTSYVSRRSGAQSDSVTCGCLYIGQWKGAKFNGRGTAFYSVTDTAESLMRQQPLLLIRTVFERHTLPWSAQTLPEDPTELCALDVRSITGIQAVEDIRNASGWCIIKPLQEGMEVYDGEWVHGRKEGFGVYQWKDRAYVGEWRSGMREGFGSLEKADGSWYRGGWHLDHCHGDGEALLLPSNTRYKGAWEGGLREGRGTLTYPNGVVIEGTWVKDVLQVRISAAYPDGVHYVGGWKDSYRHGDGVLTDELGCVHQNNWDHDRRTGEGSIELFNGVLFKGTWEDDAVVDGAYYFPDGDVYAGDWDGVQCIREGSGKCTSKNGDRYDGEWHCDQHHGKGTMLYADQLSKYEGDWAKNKRHGYGTLTDAEGVYEGHFEADVRSGEGVQRSPDGSHYVGSWKDNHRAGRGVYYSAKDDMTYEGIFLHDRLQGVGKSVHQTNHDQYEGTWLDGKRQGYGTYTLPNGDVMRGIWHRGKHQDGQVQYDFATGKYVGDWHNSMRHGRGTQVNTDGTVYEGEWVNNLPHGRGRLTKADGETLECLWKEGEMTDGVGVLTSIDGSVYRGELRGSTPHGRGELTYPDGTTFSGLFTDGIYEL